MEKALQSATFTAKEAAQYLGVSYSTLLTLANKRIDQLPHIKIGSKYIFRKDALDRWMSEQDGVKTEVMGDDFKVNISSDDILAKKKF